MAKCDDDADHVLLHDPPHHRQRLGGCLGRGWSSSSQVRRCPRAVRPRIPGPASATTPRRQWPPESPRRSSEVSHRISAHRNRHPQNPRVTAVVATREGDRRRRPLRGSARRSVPLPPEPRDPESRTSHCWTSRDPGCRRRHCGGPSCRHPGRGCGRIRSGRRRRGSGRGQPHRADTVVAGVVGGVAARRTRRVVGPKSRSEARTGTCWEKEALPVSSRTPGSERRRCRRGGGRSAHAVGSRCPRGAVGPMNHLADPGQGRSLSRDGRGIPGGGRGSDSAGLPLTGAVATCADG